MKKILVLSVLLVSVCSCSITREDIDTAEEICKPNGGIAVLAQGLGGAIVTCNNGVCVSLRHYVKI